MKILFFGTPFPDADDRTSGVYNLELCKALLKKNHDVRAIAPRPWKKVLSKKFKGEKFEPSPKAIDANLMCEYPTFIYPPGMWRKGYGYLMYSAANRVLNRWRKEWQPDAVISYWAHPDGEAGYRIAEKYNVPSTVIVGGSDVLIIPDEPGRKPMVERALQRNTSVVTVCDGLHQPCVDLGTNPDAIQTIMQGIDTNQFTKGNVTEVRNELGIPTDKKILLWVGRMVSVKDLDTLIAAAILLKEKGEDFILYLAGSGAEKDRVEDLIVRKQLSDHVKCIGRVNHDDLPKWYRAADCAVLSSLSEGLPNVLREALASGTPFVSTDVGSVREIADPRYALMVEPKNPEAFAEAVSKILHGDYKANAQSYEPRTWEEMATDFEQLLQKLIQEKDDSSSENTKSKTTFLMAANIF